MSIKNKRDLIETCNKAIPVMNSEEILLLGATLLTIFELMDERGAIDHGHDPDAKGV